MITNTSIQKSANLDQSSLIKKTEINDQSYVEAILSKQQNFLTALFPTKLQRAIKNSEIRIAKTEMERREKFLELNTKFQLEAASEVYNQLLLKGKANERRGTLEYYTEQYNLLCDSINKETKYFNKQIQLEYAELDKINIKTLRDLDEKRIIDMINNYHLTIKKLIEEFVHILAEKI